MKKNYVECEKGTKLFTNP